MSQRVVGAGAAAKKRQTPKQVLDALRDIPALEHAHCVHHLRLHAALGGDPPDGRDDVAPAVREAASAAIFIAQGDMFHLKDVNRVLVRGGWEPVLDRAAQFTPSAGRPIDLGPLTPAQFVTFPKREKAFAAALDAKYGRLLKASSVRQRGGRDSSLLAGAGVPWFVRTNRKKAPKIMATPRATRG